LHTVDALSDLIVIALMPAWRSKGLKNANDLNTAAVSR
jgi:hypothetical protein